MSEGDKPPHHNIITRIVNYYNTNATFKSLVSGLEGAFVSALTAWVVTMGYGIPMTKSAWVALAAFVGKGLWGWFKRWLQNNVATEAVATKAQGS